MTTASTASNIPFSENRFLHLLCGLFLAMFVWSGIHPVVRPDWWLENGMVFILAAFLIATYRWLPLSDLSYLLIFIFLCMHEWGAHYRYALDPIGEWMKRFQATQRNQFDRWTHFSFGLLMYYPQREILVRRAKLWSHWAMWVPVVMILGYGAAYELIEAGAAAVLSPEAAEAFLALQGDPWDTHKDMLMALLGATVAMTILWMAMRWRASRARD